MALGDSAQQQTLAEKPTEQPRGLRRVPEGRGGLQLDGSDPAPAPPGASSYYEQAVALDSAFALAWARLSRAHSLHQLVGTPSPALRRRGALARPSGRWRWRPTGRKATWRWATTIAGSSCDYAGASRSTARAQRQSPVQCRAAARPGWPSRALGRWDASLEHLHQAQRLDPRSAAHRPALTPGPALAAALRRGAGERPTAGSPSPRTTLLAYETKAMILAEPGRPGGRPGDRREAAGRDRAHPRSSSYLATYWELYWLLDDDQQRLLLRLPPSAVRRRPRRPGASPWPDVRTLRGDHGTRAGLRRLGADRVRGADPGDAGATRSSTRSTASRSRTRAGRPRRSARASGPSRCADRHGRLSPGPYIQHQLARIYILVGEPEKALDQLEPLLKMPYYLSPAWLGIDPTFDPLRNNPAVPASSWRSTAVKPELRAQLAGGARRPLRARARARPRRHGHGLPRAGPQARPPGRPQGAAPRARRHARPRALPARDPARRPAAAPAHPDRPRLGREPAGPALVHHALRRGRDAARPAAARAAARRSTTRSGSRARRPARWTTPTSTASSTATSSRRTSCSPGTARAGGRLRHRPGARRRRRG